MINFLELTDATEYDDVIDFEILINLDENYNEVVKEININDPDNNNNFLVDITYIKEYKDFSSPFLTYVNNDGNSFILGIIENIINDIKLFISKNSEFNFVV